MPDIRFQRQYVTAKIRNPLKNFELTEERIEIRTDPLLGHTMRISKPKGLDKIPEDNPLQDFVSQSQPCFFCGGKVETQTPMIPREIHKQGRIQVGEALLFPNLSGFGKYSGVCIFSKEHFIPLKKFSVTQISNALKACQVYFQKCAKIDNDVLYPSINGNYLLPAGSSILHPHLQPFLDPVPTNYHRNLLNSSREYAQRYQTNFWYDLISCERNSERFLFESNYCFFFTPYAPMGFNEVGGIVGNGKSYLDFEPETLKDLAASIEEIFKYYHKINHNSFNLVIFSPPWIKKKDSYMPCLIKICTRPVFTPLYRNDVTFFEKFHAETMLDKAPEEVAKEYHRLMA